MKKLLIITCMMFGGVCTANANNGGVASDDNTALKAENKVAVLAEKRADYLSDKMIRELRLNNYQSRKVRAINQEVVSQKMAIEHEFAGNQQLINQKCKTVCAERDQVLENVLSTEQYNDYFGNRTAYNQAEQEYMASLNQAVPANTVAVTASAAALAN